MSKKLNLSHLSEAEINQIMGVIHKDFQHRREEKRQIKELREDLAKQRSKVQMLLEKPNFNDTHCVICLETFGLLVRRKRSCYKCQVKVCSKCSLPRSRKVGQFMCPVCSKEKSLHMLTNQWLHGNHNNADHQYGSSEVVRYLYRRSLSSASDTETDSGYLASSTHSDFAHQMQGPCIDDVSYDSDTADTFGLNPFPELNLRSSRSEQNISRAVSQESLTSQGQSTRSLTPVATQTNDLEKPTHSDSATCTDSPRGVDDLSQTTSADRSLRTPIDHSFKDSDEQSGVLRRPRSSASDVRPRSYHFDLDQKHRSKDAEGLYRGALDSARRSEEFKFKVKFDNLLVELHQTIQEKTPEGLSTSFTSPSYGEVMLEFRGKVKDLLKHLTHRLTIAHESFDADNIQDNATQKVKQDVSKFIEDLIGENLDLTSDEAVSDLSSLSDDSGHEQNSFEDLIAQAVVSKLIETHRREVTGSLDTITANRKQNVPEAIRHSHNLENFKLNTVDHLTNGHHTDYDDVIAKKHKDALTSDSVDGNKSNRPVNLADDRPDDRPIKPARNKPGPVYSNGEHTSEDLLTSLDQPVSNDVSNETDIEKDFEELKEFVRKTQSSARRKVEAVELDELCEVKEELLAQSRVDHDEHREEFLTRYSVFDKVNSSETDFSQFENIDFFSGEIDPDLLSMNLDIIPEETEEELEKEEDDDRKWRANWIFKGTNGSLSDIKSVNKTISRPEMGYMPQIGSRYMEQFSDPNSFSLSDPDGSDEEENSFYPNTSKEIATITSQRSNAGNHYRAASGNISDDSDYGFKQRVPLRPYDGSQDYLDDISPSTGPLVIQSPQEMKLLQDLIPADNDDPKFVVLPESVTVQEGEPITFSCRVAGTQPIDVFWYREGEEVEEFEESEDAELSCNGDKHSISLYNTNKSMAGQYMCIALNENGKATQYLVVSVKSNKHELKKPEFIKGLKDVEVTEGQSVKFRVKVKGYPPPRIHWYKDGQLLKSSKSCRLEKFGNRDYILTIDYATMDDDAEYTVCARNVAGEVKQSAQVIVEPQSESPIKRQRHSSVTTSAASDSDSDRAAPLPRSNFLRSSSPSPLTVSSSKRVAAIIERQPISLNSLDRKMTATQKKIEREEKIMQEDTKRLSALVGTIISIEERVRTVEMAMSSLVFRDIRRMQSLYGPTDQAEKNPRILSTLEILETAEEIIKQEKSSAAVDRTDGVVDRIDGFAFSSQESSVVLNPQVSSGQFQDIIESLSLPDTLDDLPSLSSQETHQPVKSTLELSINRSRQASGSSNSSSRPKSDSSGTILLVSSGDQMTKVVPHSLSASNFNLSEANAHNTSFDSGQGPSLQDISTSLASSFSSNSSSRDNVESDMEQARKSSAKIDHDPEAQQADKKKVLVTLDPFFPRADIVDRNSSVTNPTIEVNSVDIGLTSPRLSTPRQSIDSGVSVSSKLERPAAVHMVGHTSEEDVPESRTEFNTDGSIELPSVNKLRAMFSKDDDLGDGNFKREDTKAKVHSITARSVSKNQLEKLRASDQKTMASTSQPSLLQVPGETLCSSLKLNHSSVHMPATPIAIHQTSSYSDPPNTSAYIDMKTDKEPVLIYPETESSLSQPSHPLPSKKTKAPQPPQSTPPQTKLQIHNVEGGINEVGPKNAPRIKSGCISARTAFWERKMIDGSSVNDNEFPQMLEDGEVQN